MTVGQGASFHLVDGVKLVTVTNKKEKMEFTMRTIGRHHSFAVHRERQTPIQASRSQAIGMVEIYPEFAGGLKDI